MWRFYDMSRMLNRLETLQEWSIDFVVKKDVAKSGLYYAKCESDSGVKCFSCDIILDVWNIGDVADEKHKAFSPDCPFMNRPDISEENYPEPRWPLLNALHYRLETYDNWIESLPITPTDLAKAGFFYKNQSDRVCCYQCNISINRWRPDDDPWFRHAAHSPDCFFVRIVKGDKFVSDVQTTISTNSKSNENVVEDKEDVDKVEEDSSMEQIDEDRACMLCFSYEKCVAFIPCGHVVACPRCSLSVLACPLCRGNIEDIVRLK